METKKILLTEDEMPRQWYNILADIKNEPAPGPGWKPNRSGNVGTGFSDESDRAGSQH